MNVTIRRIMVCGEATLGLMHVDGKFLCFTLEDAPREIKIPGKTRIPEGEYKTQVRKSGRLYDRYKDKFDWFDGMIGLVNVPGFFDILIHIGNTVSDTLGCVLVGFDAHTINLGGMPTSFSIIYSNQAFEKFYKMTIDAAKEGSLMVSIVDDHS